MTIHCLEMPGLVLDAGADDLSGEWVLGAVLDLAQSTVARLHALREARGLGALAAIGRLRGSGRGMHFGRLVDLLERDRPLELVSPFEGSHRVAGAAWELPTFNGGPSSHALAKLRWSAGADDLPMHVHEHSDRFIIVHEGRGFFHVTDQTVEQFDGSNVRSIPVRERDVCVFSRGVVHTFSTLHEPMTLLSSQLPYLPFDDPRQYRLPKHVWTARENPEKNEPVVGCDPAWTVLAAV